MSDSDEDFDVPLPPGHQTFIPTKTQTTNPTNNQTSKQANDQTIDEHSNKTSVDQLSAQSKIQSLETPNIQPSDSSKQQETDLTGDHSNPSSIDHSINQPINRKRPREDDDDDFGPPDPKQPIKQPAHQNDEQPDHRIRNSQTTNGSINGSNHQTTDQSSNQTIKQPAKTPVKPKRVTTQTLIAAIDSNNKPISQSNISSSKQTVKQANKQAKLELHLNRLPKALNYEKSYMHRDHVTHINQSINQSINQTIVLTGSKDGVVKFWRKASAPSTNQSTIQSNNQSNNQTTSGPLQFIREFKAHSGPILSLEIDQSNSYALTIGEETINQSNDQSFKQSIKFYDIAEFDLIHFIQLPYRARAAVWINQSINQTIKSINTSINQSITKPTCCVSALDSCHLFFYHLDSSQPLSFLTINQSISQSIDQSIDQSIERTDDMDSLTIGDAQAQPNNQSNNQSNNQPNNQSDNQTNDQSASLFTGHIHPITILSLHPIYPVVVSVDSSGLIDYWMINQSNDQTVNQSTASTNQTLPPASIISFTSKLDTDLYSLVTKKHHFSANQSNNQSNNQTINQTIKIITSLTFSPTGQYFVTTSLDLIVRVWSFKSGKIVRQYDESLPYLQQRQIELSNQPINQSNNQSSDQSTKQSSKQSSPFLLDSIDFGRRIALEKQFLKEYNQSNNQSNNQSHHATSHLTNQSINQTIHPPPCNAVFDDSENFLIYSSITGIQVINLISNQLVRLIARSENIGRIITIRLFQGLNNQSINQTNQTSQSSSQSALQARGVNQIMSEGNAWQSNNQSTTQSLIKSEDGQSNNQSNNQSNSQSRLMFEDPALFVLTWRSDRFYIFTDREPSTNQSNNQSNNQTNNQSNNQTNNQFVNRDVYNERPVNVSNTATTNQTTNQSTNQTIIQSNKPVEIVIHTSLGDIACHLFPSLVPKTVNHLIQLIKKNHFNQKIFHRVIPDFMIQCGESATPSNNQSNNQSIDDEFHPSLKHDKPGILSMANAGPHTGWDQFFITTQKCPWLDQKHAVFGRVVRGMEIVTKIEHVPCEATRPCTQIFILSIDIVKQ